MSYSKNQYARKFSALLFVAIVSFVPMRAATWYVDSSATGATNGTSWANAWTSLPSNGVSGGDTVYISGGPSGSTRTYNMSTYWTPAGGSSGNKITYQIGQDSSHNGTAIFNRLGGVVFSTGGSYITFSGDAGDGAQHFKTQGYSQTEFISYWDHFRVAYVDCSDGISRVGSFTSLTPGVEIDHCNFNVTDLGADHGVALLSCAGTTYDDIKFHDNTIRVPRVGSGFGADGVQISGVGYSVYNNTITGYNSSYTGYQHQDGVQSTGGDSYVKIHDNTFINISNYAVFGDAYFGGFTHVRVYNNIAAISDSVINGGSPGGFIFGTDGGYIGASPCVFNDVVIANNVTADYNWGNTTAGAALNNPNSSNATSFVSCYAVNNIFVNGTSIFGSSGNTTSTISNNVAITASNAASIFKSYTTYGGLNNDYHLKSTATSLIGQGLNLFSFFTTDRDGNLKLASGSWDVGAYSSTSSGTGLPINAPTNAKIAIVTQ